MQKAIKVLVILLGIYVINLEAYKIDSSKKELQEYFSIAEQHFPTNIDKKSIRGIIVPHAGYFYSGLCAATAYRSIAGDHFNHVILLGPSHYTTFKGIALPNYNEIKNDLGTIPVDSNACNILKNERFFTIFPAAHQKEHSISIQIPFLQLSLKNFKIIPLIVGELDENTCASVSESLKKIVTKNTIIIASSDFTHYGPDYNYVPFKKDILAKIKLLDAKEKTACGLNAMKILKKIINLPCHTSLYYTSAQLENARNNGHINIEKLLSDLPDEKIKNSVSYAGLIFSLPTKNTILTGYEQKVLLKLARNSISRRFESKEEHPPIFCGLKSKSGAFVTINTKKGSLRGCIGRIISDKPLYKTVEEMAIAAAFEDNRFMPLTKKELDSATIDITVLTAPKKINSYKDIVIGRDGIILKKSGISSVFLPQVPVSFKWNIEKTLEELSEKAGLDRNAYKKNCSFEVFEGFEFKESL